MSDIRPAGRTIARLIADEKAFDSIPRAAVALDCEFARSAIEQAGFVDECEIICLVLCSWR